MSGFGTFLGSLFSQAGPLPAPAHSGEETHASVEHPVKTRSEAVARYGAVKDGVWVNEDQWMISLDIDSDLGKLWLIDGKPETPLKRIRCNRDMLEPLKQAIKNMKDRDLTGELKSYDGCLSIRNVRGSSLLSCHAYGLAIDLNCDTNPLGGKSSLSAEFVKAWKDAGFSWGGDFASRKDPMHFSFAWE